MTAALVAAIGFAAATALVTAAIMLPGTPRLAVDRRRPDQPAEPGLLTSSAEAVGGLIGRVMPHAPQTFSLLELAGSSLRPADLITRTAIGAVAVLAVTGLAGAWGLGLLVALLSPLAVWAWLQLRVSRRRAAFAVQLDDLLQLLAGSLRAGHSFSAALAFVADEAEEPAASELTRVLNQARMGRDLDGALLETAGRMKSTDFTWVAQAISINREVGGNLADVLEQTAVTVRERAALGRQVQALSAEGRMSAIILMALPVVMAAAMVVLSPGYISGLVSHLVGHIMIGIGVVLLVIGGIWMRVVTRVEV